MKNIIILLSIIIFGCNSGYEKPFIIIKKSESDYIGNIKYGKSCFTYQDKNNNTVMFWELSNKYLIGDTIK